MRNMFLICLILLLGATSTVVAQPTDKAEAERLATVLAAQAKSAYAGGRYGDAASLFMKAYAKVAEPTLVYNAARAYQKADRGKEALPLFRLYLNLAHHDDEQTRAGRKEAEQHIAEIEKSLSEQEVDAQKKRRELEKKAAAANKPPPVKPPPVKPPPVKPPPVEPAPVKNATISGRKLVHRPDLFQRVTRISQPGHWTPQENKAVIIGGVGLVALLTGITLHAIETDLEALDASAEGQPVQSNGRTLYPKLTQQRVNDALQSHNALSYIGNTLIVGGIAASGVATWLWLTAPHEQTLQVTTVDGGALVLVGGRF